MAEALIDPDSGSQFPFDPVLMQKNRGDMADFSKWQLENIELVEGVFYILNGYHREVDDNGAEKWVKNESDEPTLSVQGAREVQSLLYPLTQKNVLLSNLGEERINIFTMQTVGNIIIRLGSDPVRYGLTNGDGVADVSKLYKVMDIVETTIYSALTRSNNYRTLEELNRGHQVHEMVRAQQEKRGFGLFRPKRDMEGYA